MYLTKHLTIELADLFDSGSILLRLLWENLFLPYSMQLLYDL